MKYNEVTTTGMLMKHAHEVLIEPDFDKGPMHLEFLRRAMKAYAEAKAQHFAGWIANQQIKGRTYDKLWLDYLKEHPLE